MFPCRYRKTRRSDKFKVSGGYTEFGSDLMAEKHNMNEIIMGEATHGVIQGSRIYGEVIFQISKQDPVKGAIKSALTNPVTASPQLYRAMKRK